MDHKTLREKLSEFCDGTLSASERTEAETHLKACEECRNSYQRWKTIGASLSNREEKPVSEAFTQAVMNRIETIERKNVPTRIVTTWLAPAMGIAAMLFLAVLPGPARGLSMDSLFLGASANDPLQWAISAERPQTDEMLKFVLEES